MIGVATLSQAILAQEIAFCYISVMVVKSSLHSSITPPEFQQHQQIVPSLVAGDNPVLIYIAEEQPKIWWHETR